MPRASNHYNVVVIGSGASGSALAARLSEDPQKSVLVLEAGRHYGGIESHPPALKYCHSGAFAMPGSADHWPFMAQLTGDRVISVARGKTVGGSSAVNGAFYGRGAPADYDGWAAAGNVGWSYEDVLPFFIKAETDLDFGDSPGHGAQGPMVIQRRPESAAVPIIDAFRQACFGAGFPEDLDINSATSAGVAFTPTNASNGRRMNAALRYLIPVEGRPNLTVQDRTFVHAVTFTNGRADGVVYQRDGVDGAVSADEIVLCAGGINTPHLLMLSGVGPADKLQQLGINVVHDSPYVGQNLMDHPFVGIPYRTTTEGPVPGGLLPVGPVILNYTATDSSITDDMCLLPAIYSKSTMLFGARSQSLVDRARGALFLRNPWATWKGVWGGSAKAALQDFRQRKDLQMFVELSVELSRGELTLTSADPSVLPQLSFRYMSEPEDLRRMRDGVRLVARLLEHPAYRRIGAQLTTLTDGELSSDGELDRWILANLASAAHTAGTCKMGPTTDATAVVDPRGRVHGVEGLRVADLSIMPTLTRRGPHASAIMIGERMAALIAEESS
ncbi:GMC family oxidoreductase N-terminal domain-containing protein [Rhodococcus sp. IEGM 1307]|uniref:GMC family oxidoreductase n=1 Tax=Rhodococcus sp. IEGM 1307 TaxID=3047091 RepID=UPI0024B67184|nr:GMC family oxidoreductase N-terminal domain-containing protein [Rhodococcus sp. IEGM 1307]MDI9979964.1 GMC family oxidoreductase N-terminal domain-containing protein [Rhodococcus sp. IEGM 1307]